MKTLVIGMCGNSLFYNKESNELLNEEPGGKGYNQAVAIKKLGGDVSFLGAIANDASGDLCSRYLDDIGVNNLLIKKEGATTFAKILVDQNGNNEVIVNFGTVLSFDELYYIKKQILIHDIILLQNEIDVNLNIEIIKYAKESNKVIVMNPAPLANWMKNYLNYFDILTPNEGESKALFDLDTDTPLSFIFKEAQAKNLENLIITLGDKGVAHIKNYEVTMYKAQEVKAIDTTGAGDLMNACIVYGLMNNMNIDESIKLGIKACAYSVQRRYVLASYPTLKELL